MEFSDVIGQEETKRRLQQMMNDERIPHALMFCGPQGCGKMPLAMALATQLLVDSAENKENAKAMLRKWEHPDLHFVYPTIKLPGMSSDHQPVSSDFIKEWRQLIAENVYITINQWMKQIGATTQQAVITGAESDELARHLSLKASQGGKKVAIVWLPERMNLTSANKLLKLLEEPPKDTIFIMVSEEPEKLLETIRSRTQRINIKSIETQAIEQALKEKRGVDNETAHRTARTVNGNWNKALEILQAGNENQEFFAMFQMLMRLCYMRNVKDLKRWSEAVTAYGREKDRRMLEYFIKQVRENFIYNFHNPELTYMTGEEEAFAQKFSRFINEANVVEIAQLLQRAHRDIGQNANPKIVFYDMALNMIVLLLRK